VLTELEGVEEVVVTTPEVEEEVVVTTPDEVGDVVDTWDVVAAAWVVAEAADEDEEDVEVEDEEDDEVLAVVVDVDEVEDELLLLVADEDETACVVPTAAVVACGPVVPTGAREKVTEVDPPSDLASCFNTLNGQVEVVASGPTE